MRTRPSAKIPNQTKQKAKQKFNQLYSELGEISHAGSPDGTIAFHSR